MKVSIYGTGYVGLVTGACLAELGHDILCIDIDADKIQHLKAGVIPIYEPGLETLVKNNRAAGRLHFSTHAERGVTHGLLQFICVNTPTLPTGGADINHVKTVARTIAAYMQDYRLIINKSTAPVGTVTTIKKIIIDNLPNRNTSLEFDIAANPEFLKEGDAINDFMQPDRIIVGVENERTSTLLNELYAPLIKKGFPLIAMTVASAELCKYAANAMLATKISFINEIANVAERLGADIDQVRSGIARDPRIGPHFINPGCGYGGSCFPKDVKALIHMAKEQRQPATLLTAVDQVNQRQKHILFQKINAYFKDDLSNKKMAVWGLAFKPNTNDIREASSRVLLEALWQAGCIVHAYDPIAMPEIAKLYGGHPNLILSKTKEATLHRAAGLAIVTEWDEFHQADLAMIKERLATPVIFDGRNIFSPEEVRKQGIRYFGIGK